MALALSPVVPSNVDDSDGVKYEDRDDSGRKKAWDERKDVDGNESVDDKEPPAPTHYWYDRPLLVCMIAFAVIDNAMSYAAFFAANGVRDQMYSVVDVQLVFVPWLTSALISFACLGTTAFVALVVLVECCKMPLYHEIMNLRIYLSAIPCGLCCGLIVYFSEQSNPVPFAALMLTVFFAFAWCLHMRLRWSYQLNVCSRIVLDVSWFFAFGAGLFLLALFFSGRMDIITKSSNLKCPFAANKAMPIKIPMLDSWYCSPFDSRDRTVVWRTPVVDADTAALGGAPRQLFCSDTFVDIFGVSIEPHEVLCPTGCLVQFAGSGLVGCGIYSLDSPICVAAIQSGALTDAGGTTVVYGRLGLAKFEMCSRNSVQSEERRVTAYDAVQLLDGDAGGRRLGANPPKVLSADGIRVPQAFHFNNFPDSQEFFWLKRWEVMDRDDMSSTRPWTRIEATVSARIAGLEFTDEKIRLGRPDDQPTLFGETTYCKLVGLGVDCPGAAWVAMHLDFCLPDQARCLN